MRWIKSVIAIKEFPLLRVKRNFDEIIRFAMKYAVLWFSLFYKNISKVWYEIKTFSYQLLLLKSLTYLKIATLLLSFKYQMSWETYEKEKILFNYIIQTYICHYPGISKQTYFFEFTIDDLYFKTTRITWISQPKF